MRYLSVMIAFDIGLTLRTWRLVACVSEHILFLLLSADFLAAAENSLLVQLLTLGDIALVGSRRL